MVNKKTNYLIIIFVGLFISIYLTINNINKYDKNAVDENGKSYHQMIKYDTFRYSRHGNEIKNQLKEGVNFFKTGREHYTKYLPSRLFALYYYFFDYELFDKSGEFINTGIHLNFLILQNLFYYFSILILFYSLKRSINSNVLLIIICFLSLEPNLIQYHGTFWSESVFFSLQILLISLILRPTMTITSSFFTGLLLALLSLQKEYAIFYIIPIIIFFIIFYKKRLFVNIITLFIGFFLILSILGFNNYLRSGSFYLMTATTKTDLHMLLVDQVVSKKLNLTAFEFEENEGKAAKQWINDNSIEMVEDLDDKTLSSNNKPTLWIYRSFIKNENDKIKLDEFIKKRSFEYILKYPFDFFTHVIKKSFHITLLNPFHIYSDHNFKSGEVYYLSKKHKELIPYRISYSLIMYLICLYGVFILIREKKYKILIFSTLSIVYFFAPVSWHGNTRYFLPSYLYFCLFFGFAIENLILSKIKRIRLT